MTRKIDWFLGYLSREYNAFETLRSGSAARSGEAVPKAQDQLRVEYLIRQVVDLWRVCPVFHMCRWPAGSSQNPYGADVDHRCIVAWEDPDGLPLGIVVPLSPDEIDLDASFLAL